MKIQVIGCSTTWTDRPTSSYCVNDKILVDAGEGTFKYYKDAGVDLENISHIFITHFHSDHTVAVINHIYNVIWHNKRGQAKELDIYGPKGVEKYFKDLIQVVLPEYSDMDMSGFIHYHEIENFNTPIKVDDLEISCFQLKHGDLEDIAYTFDDGNSKVGFSGDCTYTPNLDKFVASADTMFLECCDLKTTQSHLGCDQFIKYVEKYPDKKFYAIHCVDTVYNNAEKLYINVAKAGQTYLSSEREKELN